ncbi:hypothetical protein BCR44DRAFT_46247 [Catenaria anguillulae PL171]|uniref:Uncharacterized protein n=1 Tax=Catenaria anguillulae PL171 TaxID=765915 RepID=A0A1Y2H506_9FUNG|nr:hypothetical protein BCR44DRAFT_46247 [Catenaria anguillulae PL171]
MYEPWSVTGFSGMFTEMLMYATGPKESDWNLAQEWFETNGQSDLFHRKMSDVDFAAFRAKVQGMRKAADAEQIDSMVVSVVDERSGKRRRKVNNKELFAHEILLFLQRMRRLMPSWDNQFLSDEERRQLGKHAYTRKNPGYKTHSMRRFAAQLAAWGGMDTTEVKVWGRWDSDVVELYINQARTQQKEPQSSGGIDPVRTRWVTGKPRGEEGLEEGMVLYLAALAETTDFLRSLSKPLVDSLQDAAAVVADELKAGIVRAQAVNTLVYHVQAHCKQLGQALARANQVRRHDQVDPNPHPFQDRNNPFAPCNRRVLVSAAPIPELRTQLTEDSFVLFRQGQIPFVAGARPPSPDEFSFEVWDFSQIRHDCGPGAPARPVNRDSVIDDPSVRTAGGLGLFLDQVVARCAAADESLVLDGPVMSLTSSGGSGSDTGGPIMLLSS